MELSKPHRIIIHIKIGENSMDFSFCNTCSNKKDCDSFCEPFMLDFDKLESELIKQKKIAYDSCGIPKDIFK